MILIISSAFDKSDADVIKHLRKSCSEKLIDEGLAIEIHEVPGAIEIPVAIQYFATQNPGKFSAAIALGCVIKGESDHYELVCKSVTEGLTVLALELGIPVIQGVLACHNKDQAKARRNLGKEFAETAITMRNLFLTQIEK